MKNLLLVLKKEDKNVYDVMHILIRLVEAVESSKLPLLWLGIVIALGLHNMLWDVMLGPTLNYDQIDYMLNTSFIYCALFVLLPFCLRKSRDFLLLCDKRCCILMYMYGLPFGKLISLCVLTLLASTNKKLLAKHMKKVRILEMRTRSRRVFIQRYAKRRYLMLCHIDRAMRVQDARKGVL